MYTVNILTIYFLVAKIVNNNIGFIIVLIEITDIDRGIGDYRSCFKTNGQ